MGEPATNKEQLEQLIGASMSTPNGQHAPDSNGASTQATSTVLALDGWGPLIGEPTPNGANGSEPELALEVEPEPLSASTPDSRRGSASGWQRDLLRLTTDPQLIRVFAPAAAMVIAIIGALKLGEAYQRSSQPEPEPNPPSRFTMLRRMIALAIDPSLTPVEPEPRGLAALAKRARQRLELE